MTSMFTNVIVSKERGLVHVIAGLGINNIGKELAKTLSAHFGNITPGSCSHLIVLL